MHTVADIATWMQQIAPLELGESWDNLGLLLGDRRAPVEALMTCLTLNSATVGEAIEQAVGMVIAHHPLPFKPLSKITCDEVTGELVWKLAGAGIAVYSPHTAWDSAPAGINAQLAMQLGMRDATPLIPSSIEGLTQLGAGRIGNLPMPLTGSEVAAILKDLHPTARPRGVGLGQRVSRVGIACGSGGGLLPAALEQGCELFLTGEATYHTCLGAEEAGVALLMIGHHASERFSLETLAQHISTEFPSIRTWASKNEKDPVRTCS
ncbi:Nif3-like dinuclear metal center hexameric protein [Aureliella helgolandensis]|uniref:GTP cyclohydrolase 1 type 2 homolog n=1 Tax=Aureliella helgolandensis TaxID=2527968 RepID=A0A518GAQ0_9BACT|nr:Nif3-like dinuclear metal center hexameric protein [Aureliella helgolandensis]QDV25685.1 Putative GTP cyclohydrolase 1 type 2 [Aureliella helgolandensis]